MNLYRLAGAVLCAAALLVVGCPEKSKPTAPTPSPTPSGPVVPISLVTSSAISNQLPFDFFNGKEWTARAGEYAKIHMYFDAPATVERVVIEPCVSFKKPATVFVNFDEYVAKATKDGLALAYTFTRPVSARSITVNFEENRDVCIKEVKLIVDGQEAYVKTPRIVSGTVKASSTLEPLDAYDAYYMFDSRLEYAWASDEEATGVTLSLAFAKPQTVQSIRLWNGYQRSDNHCWSNSRVKTVQVTGDNGYTATVSATDTMGSQLLTLPTPFKGQKLDLTITESFRGKRYKEVVISEIRFSENGSDWFMLDPLPQLKSVAARNAAKFAEANVSSALDGNLTGSNSPSAEAEGVTQSGDWTVRLRSDGSFYLDGSAQTENWDENEGKDEKFFALGNYQVKSVTDQGMKFRIFGHLRKLKEEYELEGGFDCNGCGHDCNAAQGDTISKIFDENLYLVNTPKGLVLRNIDKKPNLSFKRIELTN